MTEPLSVISDGLIRVVWVPGASGIANPAEPTVAEVTPGGSVKVLAPYFTDAGFGIQQSEDTVTDPRLTSVLTFTRPGRRSNTIQLMYTCNPQDPTNNVATVALPDRAIGFFVVRYGVEWDEDIEAGEKVDVWPVQLGGPYKSNAANAPVLTNQIAYVRARAYQDVAVVGS